ncbi:STAS domain-containing protein [Peribacillus sp. SCS-37]|uniref:STAS domain-containing protein n=1 Tax=Paraperibacillus esterisolvens TaxID=3115296 RepID=UPI003905835D
MVNFKEKLYDYIKLSAKDMTLEWLSSRKIEDSIYSKDASETQTQELFQNNQDFITVIADRLIGMGTVINWAEQIGRNRATSNTPISEVINHFKVFRTIFLKRVELYALEFPSLTIKEFNNACIIINQTFDEVIIIFTEQYKIFHDRLVAEHRAKILEISVPVIPLVENDIGVLPLVGNIDTERASILKEQSIRQASQLQLNVLIIDVSGVPAIDEYVASELFIIVDTLSLLGIESAITGIRPEIAQIIVKLGLTLKNCKTFSKLKDALRDFQRI